MRSVSCVTSNIILSILKVTYKLLMAVVIFLSQNGTANGIMCCLFSSAVPKKPNGLRNESAVVQRKNSMRVRKHVQIGSM